MESVYIVSAVRTPIGKFGGSLAGMTAADLGEIAAKAALDRSGVPVDQVDEAIFGNARQAPLIPPLPLLRKQHRRCLKDIPQLNSTLVNSTLA